MFHRNPIASFKLLTSFQTSCNRNCQNSFATIFHILNPNPSKCNIKSYSACDLIGEHRLNPVNRNVRAFSSNTNEIQIPVVTYEYVKDLPNHPEKILIDVREPSELQETGSIPSSINIPRKKHFIKLNHNISNNKNKKDKFQFLFCF